MTGPIVAVCGTIRLNRHFRVHHAPANGERVVGETGMMRLGGRGANQAVAVARSGVHVKLFGVVGDDTTGDRCLEVLRKYEVDTTNVRVIAGAHTAEVLRLNAEDGTTATVEVSDIDRLNSPIELIDELKTANVILAQGGLFPSVTRELANLEFGGRFVLNLTPVRGVNKDTFAHADPLIVNEVEATELLDTLAPDKGLTAETGPVALAEALRDYAKSVVVTFGARGCVFIDGADAEMYFQPSSQLEVPLDNVGAGDAFVGALAARLARGADLHHAVRFGSAAGALATRRHGMVASFGDAEQVEELAAELPPAVLVTDDTDLHRAQR